MVMYELMGLKINYHSMRVVFGMPRQQKYWTWKASNSTPAIPDGRTSLSSKAGMEYRVDTRVIWVSRMVV